MVPEVNRVLQVGREKRALQEDLGFEDQRGRKDQVVFKDLQDLLARKVYPEQVGLKVKAEMLDLKDPLVLLVKQGKAVLQELKEVKVPPARLDKKDLRARKENLANQERLVELV